MNPKTILEEHNVYRDSRNYGGAFSIHELEAEGDAVSQTDGSHIPIVLLFPASAFKGVLYNDAEEEEIFSSQVPGALQLLNW